MVICLKIEKLDDNRLCFSYSDGTKEIYDNKDLPHMSLEDDDIDGF